MLAVPRVHSGETVVSENNARVATGLEYTGWESSRHRTRQVWEVEEAEEALENMGILFFRE